jgi:hypothetical protein
MQALRENGVAELQPKKQNPREWQWFAMVCEIFGLRSFEFLFENPHREHALVGNRAVVAWNKEGTR